ncbi:M20/M25/M40 family metallo-hydrolase [Algoriphagus lacus]|uniref:M20/M25/M40 family metallo-hydrolase n=1 Tax=Algoriphagus lacus TaxID=2056311 RepID=A0A418PPU9_9BACT|nr:M20/M25/M40 family metallo-hydrolase [Algoriphagus lacus]RIW14119.1 M20/M25/M40 family metallo-hydrolase [Algoriphagus lacus]
MKYFLFTASFLTLSISVFAQAKKPGAQEKYLTEVAAIAKNNAVKAAFAEIDRLNPQTTEELIQLTEIPAPPFMEGTRGLKYKQMLEEAGGVKVWMDSIGNVLALRKGTVGGRIVAIDGHLDTVFPEGTDVRVKQKGDTLFAPGIGDNTRGLMVVLTVLRAMEKAQIQTKDDVLFVATVGEEGNGDLRGVKYLFDKSAIKIDSWISIDSDGVGGISNQGTGSIRYKVTVSGPGGHSWGDFGLVNPHHALGKMINYFSDAAAQFSAVAKTKTSFNVGKIGGGTSVNSIPFESWMEVDMRSEDDESLTTMDSIFKASLQKGLTEYNNNRKTSPALSMQVDQIGFRPSGITPEESSLVQRSMAAIQSFGITPSLFIMSGNANWPISKGIPAVTLGWGGKSDNSHALDEWWIDDQGTDAIKLAFLTLVAEAGISQ